MWLHLHHYQQNMCRSLDFHLCRCSNTHLPEWCQRQDFHPHKPIRSPSQWYRQRPCEEPGLPLLSEVIVCLPSPLEWCQRRLSGELEPSLQPSSNKAFPTPKCQQRPCSNEALPHVPFSKNDLSIDLVGNQYSHSIPSSFKESFPTMCQQRHGFLPLPGSNKAASSSLSPIPTSLSCVRDA